MGKRNNLTLSLFYMDSILGLDGRNKVMNIQTLADKELLFGYKDVLLYYEQHVKLYPNGYALKRLQKYLELQHITLVNNMKDLALQQNFQQKPVSFFCFNLTKRHSTLASLLYHLRNSFAHALVEITMISNRPYYCFKDVYPNKQKAGQVSMIGQIPKKAFKGFIQELKANQNKLKSLTASNISKWNSKI